MAVLKIREYPDIILSQKAKPVIVIDKKILNLVSDMSETLHAKEGLGLAAPQVGESIRLFIYHAPEINPGYIAVINPQIIKMSGSLYEEEGCLSIPEYRTKVNRAERILVKGKDIDGKEFESELSGLLARIFQHEIDHLDGVLLINRISKLKLNMFNRKFKKHDNIGVT